MIKASELRIGNLIMEDGEVINVHMLGSYIGESINDMGILFDRFTSIPLTGEWLIKFGFIKRGGNLPQHCTLDIDRWRQFRFDGYEGLALQTIESGWLWHLKHIKYVHQLQNLYFALTGEELQMK